MGTTRVEDATPEDAEAITQVRNAAADALTMRHGHGHWSAATTERSVLRGIEVSRVLVARDGSRVVGTLRLATRKPWAIDPAYFRRVSRPIYLTDMAVEPSVQRRGVGRTLLERAAHVVQAWPADAIRLDAYDAPAGAGEFYARCGYREVGRVVYRRTPLVYFELVL